MGEKHIVIIIDDIGSQKINKQDNQEQFSHLIIAIQILELKYLIILARINQIIIFIFGHVSFKDPWYPLKQMK